MIVAFWNNIVLEYQLLEPGQTVTGEVFRDFLRDWVYPAIRNHRIARPALLFDNARPHHHRLVREYIESQNWRTIHQDPYSPDENPCDYDGIERLKRYLRGRQFNTILQLTDAVVTCVNAINRDRSIRGILDYRRQMQRIIDCNGGYVAHE